MLTNNLDFKRAIAQQFDPETDYSEFDEAEIDGAFEATVYQLLMKRQHPTPNTQRPTTNTDPPEFGSIIHRVVKWKGFDIGLEYTPGQVRFPGRRNSRKLRSGYGHLRNYVGADGEALDCYLAPAFFNDDETPSDRLFQVSQLSPEDGDFDEHKFLLGYQSLDEAKEAYLREMPSDYFGGIQEVELRDLEQYRKPTDASAALNVNFSKQLAEIKHSISQLQPTNFSESAITTAIESSIAPHIQKLDSLIAKLEFGEPIQLDGDILDDAEFDAIASINPADIQAALDDWEERVPDNVKNLIGGFDGDR